MLKEIILKGEQKKVLFLPATNPIQIKGVAGSGKTTVALYRAKHLLETYNNLFKEAEIAIFTFNKTLAAYIKAINPYVCGGYQKNDDKIIPRSKNGLNVNITNFHSWAFHFLGLAYGETVMQWEQIEIIKKIKQKISTNTSNVLEKSAEFFQEEISWIKGKLFKNANDYFNAKRTGRGTTDRVSKKDKAVIWDIYEKYNLELINKSKIDFDDYALMSLKKIENTANFIPPFTHIIIDEAQDLNKAQIMTISKLVSTETNSLSIIADAAQRIYKSGFIWSEVGINVRGGRTVEFKKNYRNTVQIAQASLSLLMNEKDKSDFTQVETALKGSEKPKVGYFDNYENQLDFLVLQLDKLQKKNSIQSTIILHRTNEGVKRIQKALEQRSYSTEMVKSSQPVNYQSASLKICTMSSVKGLEFDNVFIIDLNDDIIPFPPGFIESNDEFHISTERRLLYTCMTRAKKNLCLISSGNRSRYLGEIEEKFLEDITNDVAKLNKRDFPF